MADLTDLIAANGDDDEYDAEEEYDPDVELSHALSMLEDVQALFDRIDDLFVGRKIKWPATLRKDFATLWAELQAFTEQFETDEKVAGEASTGDSTEDFLEGRLDF